MIVLVGKMTKLNPLFTGMDKTYDGVIRFGEETDTLDPEGEITDRGEVPGLDRITRCIPLFLGEQQQVPPRYSAIHVEGKRSWRLARQGVRIEMPSRPVRIDQLDVLEWNKPDLTIRVSCTSGTYIRSLARDLALACDSRGHLVALNRTRVGPFTVDEAVKADGDDLTSGLYSLGQLSHRLPFAGQRILTEEETAKVALGIPPHRIWSRDEFQADGEYPLFKPDGEPAALLQYSEGQLKYRFVM